MGHSMMRKKEIFRVTTVSTKVTGLKVLVKFGMNLDKSHCLPPEKKCGPSFPFSTLRDSKVVRYIRQNLTESTTDLPVLFKFGQSAA